MLPPLLVTPVLLRPVPLLLRVSLLSGPLLGLTLRARSRFLLPQTKVLLFLQLLLVSRPTILLTSVLGPYFVSMRSILWTKLRPMAPFIPRKLPVKTEKVPRLLSLMYPSVAPLALALPNPVQVHMLFGWPLSR